MAELEDGDGTDGAPIYVALRGRVYDVSAGTKFYGPGKAYNHFVGRDASRAFATGCRAAECVSADLDGLNPSQLRELDRWMEMYETTTSTRSWARSSRTPRARGQSEDGHARPGRSRAR